MSDAQPDLAPGRKRCPYCAEDIRQEALVCHHCGRAIRIQARLTIWQFAAVFVTLVLAFIVGVLVLVYLNARYNR